jgi:hypothetical protein
MLTLVGVCAPDTSALEPEEPCLLDMSLEAFYADDTTIEATGATTLHWSVRFDNPGCRNAVQLRLLDGTGMDWLVLKQGSRSVAPAQTTTYRLRASYAGHTQWLTPAVTITVECGAGSGASGSQADTCTNCARPQQATADRDADGIPDRLEYDLAHQFFPAIQLQWPAEDRDESYLVRGKAIPYTVEPLPPGGLCDEAYECLELRYGIAYFYDHGDDVFGGAHPGDSEFYAVLVRRTASWSTAQHDVAQWTMIRDFTAAHWRAAAESSVVGAYGFCYAGVTCYESTPRTSYKVLYAAELKHALYHTIEECNNGGWWVSTTDNCPANLFSMRNWKTCRLQNVGNAVVHGAMDTSIQDPVSGLYEVWSGQPFGDATAYRDHFLAPIAWRITTGGGGGLNSGVNHPPRRLK